jgi:hypothetical protein
MNSTGILTIAGMQHPSGKACSDARKITGNAVLRL